MLILIGENFEKEKKLRLLFCALQKRIDDELMNFTYNLCDEIAKVYYKKYLIIQNYFIDIYTYWPARNRFRLIFVYADLEGYKL